MAVPPARPTPVRAALAALLVFGACAPVCAGADPPAADELVNLRLEWHAQHARRAAAEDELARAPAPRAGTATVRAVRDPAVVLNELRPALEADYTALRNAAARLDEAARARREAARAAWEDVYRQRIEFRAHADRLRAAYGFDFDAGAPPTFRFTPLDAAAGGCAGLVLVAALGLGRHVRRVTVRKARRAAAAGALGVLCAVSGCSNGSPDPLPWAAREAAALAAETEAARAAADRAERAAEEKWRAALETWVALVNAPGTNVGELVREGERDARSDFRQAHRNARLAERLAAEAEAERERLASDRDKLAGLAGGAKWRALAFAAARVALAGALFAVAVVPFVRARRAEAAVVSADAQKCPRCFGTKLVVETTAAAPDAAPRPSGYKPKGKKPAPKPPEPEADEQPKETGYVECKACSFRFLRSYQQVRRLCFPVVGVRASGKTHMLATGYDRVRKRTAPTCAAVQPAPSLGDARFEQYIDLILNMKQEAGGTVHDMPDPVMLHVRDADPAGPNTALVNLFDYSGELVNQSIDRDRLKRQAVLMDGFMLFLDPTQLYGDGVNVTLDRQLSALNEFMADMREARGVAVGQVIPVPVAVCVPKFDLLVSDNPIQGQCVPFIRRMLSELNPPPKQVTLATVQGRSALVEQMLELMFRGVDVRALVESYFGPQVMFFPVSSVSLFENELGERDLRRRTIAPFGVAEPFLWLLHMHGYVVFE